MFQLETIEDEPFGLGTAARGFQMVLSRQFRNREIEEERFVSFLFLRLVGNWQLLRNSRYSVEYEIQPRRNSASFPQSASAREGWKKHHYLGMVCGGKKLFLSLSVCFECIQERAKGCNHEPIQLPLGQLRSMQHPQSVD